MTIKNFFFLKKKEIEKTSVNYKIFFSGLSIGLATIIVQLVQTLKEVIVADQFGTGIALENFIIAFLIPGFLISVIADSIPPALLPAYERLKQSEGTKMAKNFLSWTCIALVGISSLTIFIVLKWDSTLLHPIIKNFDFERQNSIIRFQAWLLWSVVAQTGFVCLCTFFYALKKFFSTSIIRIISPLLVLTFLVFNLFEEKILALVIGTVVGAGLQFIVIFFRSVRYSLFSGFKVSKSGLKYFGKQYFPLCFAAALMGGTTLIDNSMASLLPAKNLASLNFGNKIILALLALGGTILGSSVLPYFSEMSAKYKLKDLNHSVSTYQKLILKITIPCTGLLILFSEPITKIIWQHGNFNNYDTMVVAKIQSLYALQCPFYLMGILLSRAVSSMGGNHLLALITVSNLVLNFIFNLVLMKFLGVYGIALSTSIVYLISYFMLRLEYGWLIKKGNKYSV